MSELKYPHLFEPVVLGKTLFRNRIFASPQDIYRLTGENFLDDDATAFYARKALGGFASVCVGDFMVDSRAGMSHPFQLRGDDMKGKVSLTRTSSAITRHGAIAGVELNHAGANAVLMAQREGFVYGFEEAVREDGTVVREMDEEWIERLINCFADGASLARQTGFGLINLHGGHGWAICQFMSPRDNKLKNRWGGSFENRMRFPLAVVEAVRKRVGRAMPIEMRISATEWLPDGYDEDYGIAIAKALDGKIDLLNVSIGHHEIDAASMRTHPTMFLEDGCNVRFAAAIKKAMKYTPVSCVGALTDPGMMEEIIASGQADVIELGRQSLADPDLPIKARSCREDDINKCLRCFSCFSASTVSGIFYCATNPEIGHEAEINLPPKFKKTVLVAGGGVGGMQAALTAAERGHRVILCEKTDRLGGVLLCESNIPFKKHLEEYLELQARRVRKSGIELHLNTEVTPELACSFSPDVIIAAMGARPAKPPIAGMDRENVLGAEEVYLSPEKVGKSCVIMGGGLVGLELGLYLAMEGRNVTVVEMLPSTVATPDEAGTSERIGGANYMEYGLPLVQGVAIADKLASLPNMRVMCSTKALEVTSEGLRVERPGGVSVIPADTVIYAIGQKPLTAEALALGDCAPEFYTLGDCVVPKNILFATQAAWQIAQDIGRL